MNENYNVNDVIWIKYGVQTEQFQYPKVPIKTLHIKIRVLDDHKLNTYRDLPSLSISRWTENKKYYQFLDLLNGRGLLFAVQNMQSDDLILKLISGAVVKRPYVIQSVHYTEIHSN